MSEDTKKTNNSYRYWPKKRLNRRNILLVIALGFLAYIVGIYLLSLDKQEGLLFISLFVPILIFGSAIWMIEKARTIDKKKSGETALVALVLFAFSNYFLGQGLIEMLFGIAFWVFGIAWIVKKSKKE